MKKRAILIGIVFISSLGISGLIAYKFHLDKITKSKKELIQKVNDLFQNKEVIADAVRVELSGNYDKENKNFYYLWSGGFSLYELSKESDGYVKSYTKPGQIEYLQDEYNYIYGYKFDNYRPKPDDVYNSALEFLLFGPKDHPKDIYSENKYTELKDFPIGFENTYYSIVQVEHPSEHYMDYENYGTVSNAIYKMTYQLNKSYYVIKPTQVKINASLKSNLIYAIVSSILLTLLTYVVLSIVRGRAKKAFKFETSNWKNIETGAILSIERALSGKYSVTHSEDNNVKRGTAKFLDKGKQLKISFPDAELFYKILLSDKDKLEMQNLSTNKVVKFERLGSNAYEDKPKFEL